MVCKCNVMWATSNTFWSMDFRGWFGGKLCNDMSTTKYLETVTRPNSGLGICNKMSAYFYYNVIPVQRSVRASLRKIPSSPCLVKKEIGVSKWIFPRIWMLRRGRFKSIHCSLIPGENDIKFVCSSIGGNVKVEALLMFSLPLCETVHSLSSLVHSW